MKWGSQKSPHAAANAKANSEGTKWEDILNVDQLAI